MSWWFFLIFQIIVVCKSLRPVADYRYFNTLHHLRRLLRYLTCWLHQTHSTAAKKLSHFVYRQLFRGFSRWQCCCVIIVKGKKPSLTVANKAEIVTMLKVCFSEREIAKSKTAVHQAAIKFYISGKYIDVKGRGRPRKTRPLTKHNR